jgi:hypothetical protein
MTCMFGSSVRHDVQQETCIVEAAAVKVDSRCTAPEQIVFLQDNVVKGEAVGVPFVMKKSYKQKP